MKKYICVYENTLCRARQRLLRHPSQEHSPYPHARPRALRVESLIIAVIPVDLVHLRTAHGFHLVGAHSDSKHAVSRLCANECENAGKKVQVPEEDSGRTDGRSDKRAARSSGVDIKPEGSVVAWSKLASRITRCRDPRPPRNATKHCYAAKQLVSALERRVGYLTLFVEGIARVGDATVQNLQYGSNFASPSANCGERITRGLLRTPGELLITGIAPCHGLDVVEKRHSQRRFRYEQGVQL